MKLFGIGKNSDSSWSSLSKSELAEEYEKRRLKWPEKGGGDRTIETEK